MASTGPQPSGVPPEADTVAELDEQAAAEWAELEAKYAAFRADLAANVDDPVHGAENRELLAGDPDELFEAFAIVELFEGKLGPPPLTTLWATATAVGALAAVVLAVFWFVR